MVTLETIRQWCQKSGLDLARKLNWCQGRLSDTWRLHGWFTRIPGQNQHLRQAIDQDGNVITLLVQHRRNRQTVNAFPPAHEGQGRGTRWLNTDSFEDSWRPPIAR